MGITECITPHYLDFLSDGAEIDQNLTVHKVPNPAVAQNSATVRFVVLKKVNPLQIKRTIMALVSPREGAEESDSQVND